MANSSISQPTNSFSNGLAPDYSDIRSRYVDLLKSTTQAYNLLLQAGRDNDAFSLRDSMERMSRAAGGTAWARLQAANDLRARMAAASRQLAGTTTASALSAQSNILGQIANLDQNAFNDVVQGRQLELNEAQFEWDKKQQKAKAEADRVAAANASRAADKLSASSASNTSGWNAPVATPKTQQTLSTVKQTSSPYVTEVVPQWYKDQTAYQNKYNSGSSSWTV
jgi:hypothetical protein